MKNMKNMKIKLAAGILAVSTLLSGCGSGSAVTNNDGNNNGKNGEAVITDENDNGNGSYSGNNNGNNGGNNNGNNGGNSNENPAVGGDIAFTEVGMAGNNLCNSILLADMTAQASEGSNVMYSPISMNMALGLISEGAGGSTKELLEQFLGRDNYGEYAAQYMEAIKMYNDKTWFNEYSSQLNIANALWVDDRIKLDKDFSKLADKSFDAKAANVNFLIPDEACEVINKWADKNTNGLIKEIISPSSISPDTVFCVTNSVYFESAWAESWNLSSVSEVFTQANGNEEQTNYIYNEGDAYFENDMATAFSCNYMSGIEFIGILPKQEGSFTLGELDIESLLAGRSYSVDNLYIKMPRLNFETNIDMKNMFKAIGMGELFEKTATFDRIAVENELFISSILQKTKLELDEYGTKAAAVTAIITDCASSEIEGSTITKYVYLDRPFAFMIYDRINDEVLFLGKVVTSVQ